jgi:hypothetical protein
MTVIPGQELVPSLRAVRDELFGLLEPYLGTYKLGRSARRPAFYVVGPGQVRPQWTVKGIEAVLVNRPELVSLGGVGCLPTKRVWTLQVRNFDTESTLEAVQVTLYRHFPTAMQRYMAQTETTYEQLTVELPDHILITLP